MSVREGSWDDEFPAQQNATFMRITGKHRVRILSKPLFVEVHFVNNQPRVCKGEKCPYCQSGVRKITRAAIKVLDREDMQVKILTVGSRLYDQIRGIAREWGDPSGYDIMISRSGEGLQTRYTAVPTKDTDKVPEEVLEQAESLDLYQFFTDLAARDDDALEGEEVPPTNNSNGTISFDEFEKKMRENPPQR